MKIRIEHKAPTTEEYQKLRNSTDWNKLQNSTVKKGLSNSLFSVCIYDDMKIIGIGRVIGDEAIYFYIQDVIVLPQYQKKGIGKIIMSEIEKYIKLHAHPGSFIGLMAADGVQEFYEHFGYQLRPNNRPGMYKKIR